MILEVEKRLLLQSAVLNANADVRDMRMSRPELERFVDQLWRALEHSGLELRYSERRLYERSERMKYALDKERAKVDKMKTGGG